MLFWLAFSCSSDTCRTLCANVAQSIEGCLDEWGATWEDFDVTERLEYGDRCRSEWEETRTDLEPRQLDGATAECTDAEAELPSLTCTELRVMYLDP